MKRTRNLGPLDTHGKVPLFEPEAQPTSPFAKMLGAEFRFMPLAEHLDQYSLEMLGCVSRSAHARCVEARKMLLVGHPGNTDPTPDPDIFPSVAFSNEIEVYLRRFPPLRKLAERGDVVHLKAVMDLHTLGKETMLPAEEWSNGRPFAHRLDLTSIFIGAVQGGHKWLARRALRCSHAPRHLNRLFVEGVVHGGEQFTTVELIEMFWLHGGWRDAVCNNPSYAGRIYNAGVAAMNAYAITNAVTEALFSRTDDPVAAPIFTVQRFITTVVGGSVFPLRHLH